MAYQNWIVEERRKTRVLYINRPHVLNALNVQTLFELKTIITQTPKDIRALVLTGMGEKSFAAGADISEMRFLTPLEAKQLSATGHEVMDCIDNMPIPVMAAVQGYALGGGLELALACDFIYAGPKAIFGLVESKLGIIPGFGGIARLSKRIGVAKAKEWMMSAGQYSAKEALQVGLINHLSEDKPVLEACLLACERMLQNGPAALSLIKSLANLSGHVDIKTSNLLEEDAFGVVFSTKDREEGIAAFLDKRKANF